MARIRTADIPSRKSFRLAVILASLGALSVFTDSGFNLLATTAKASTFVVTTTTDNGNNANPTPGSLRKAIIDANSNGTDSVDTIAFKIAGAGVHTFKPTVLFPVISTPTIIDGYSQLGSQPNTLSTGTNAVLRIELNGALAVGQLHFTCLAFSADGWVKGLVINRFTGPGIVVTGGRIVTITGNFVGTDPAGLAAFGNSCGVCVHDTGNTVVVGGMLPAERNLISGNDQGVAAFSGSPRLRVINNLIGTDKNAAGNVGNGEGIDCGNQCQVKANLIARNLVTGISIEGPDCLIGGEKPADRNVIILNGNGIYLSFQTNRTRVIGNSIGTDASGTLNLGNKMNGILIDADENFIGGPTAAERNFISANAGAGIELTFPANLNSIRGNYIGTNASGTAALPNLDGVSCNGADNNTIGGTLKGEGNLISGNSRYGVNFRNDAQSNLIQGNLIGTKATAAGPLANVDGVHFGGGKLNTIGGSGGKNMIAYNTGRGVLLDSGPANIDNLITENSTFKNGSLGIDLDANGLTANDLNDADSGANRLLNFPVLTSASISNGQISISGTLNSTANSNFMIHFYANSDCDPSGHGEGQTFLGSIPVTTQGNNAIFTATFQVNSAKTVTATATDSALSTSEFSQCKQVVVL